MDSKPINELPFIAGMRATPRRIVKSFFLATVMGFLIVNMNLLLRTVEDTSEDSCLSDPNCYGHVQANKPLSNGVEPVEPQQKTVLDPARHIPKPSQSPIQVLPNNVKNEMPQSAKVESTGQDNGKVPKAQVPVPPGGNSINDNAAAAPPGVNTNISHVNVAEGSALIQELLKGPHNPISPQNATIIKNFIEKINREQKIHNLDR